MENANEAQAPQEVTVEQALYTRMKEYVVAKEIADNAYNEMKNVLAQAEQALIQQQLKEKEAKIVELESKDKKK